MVESGNVNHPIALWNGRERCDELQQLIRRRRYLKTIDKFHEWTVSAWLTPGGQSLAHRTVLHSRSYAYDQGVKIILLHELKNDDGIRLFLQETWESYLKVRPSYSARILTNDHTTRQTLMNPFHELNAPIRSQTFDARIRASAKKHL